MMNPVSIRHAAVIALMLLVTQAVISSGDDIEERIKRLNIEIERTQKELEESEKALKKLKSSEQKVKAELEHNDRKIEVISQNLEKIRNAEQSIQQDVNQHQKQFDLSKNQLESRSDRYARRLRAMYKRQKVSPANMFFSTGSVSLIIRGFKMMSVVAAADVMVLHEITGKLEDLDAAMKKLQVALKAKNSLAKKREDQKSWLTRTNTSKRKILDDIQHDEELLVERKKKYEADLEHSRAELDKTIRELETKRVKVPLPSALKGYDFAAHKGNLPWPVGGKVVSHFGKVIDASTKTETKNRGIEIETKQSTPVSSIGRGRVEMTQFFRGYGNFVVIFHPPNYYTVYGHLSDILVNKGDIVLEGSIIGLSGSTGLLDNSSCRLVFEILLADQPQNPLAWLKKDTRRAAR